MNAVNDCIDLLIIGGGINGAGIANDAAGRGLSVVLCEQGDLAQATSSASSKLIHGGLRYLEHYEFSLVRKALKEREILLKCAPHLISPLQFIMPHDHQLRPAWLIRLGLFLYDHLAHSTLPKSHGLDVRDSIIGPELQTQFSKAFSYYDCAVDDARLVIANAQAALQNGARILTHTQFIDAVRQQHQWQVQLRDQHGQSFKQNCKILVNAAGPWVDQILRTLHCSSQAKIRLVKGSHIIVPKLYAGEHAFILQNSDQRVVFAIPYQQHYTLIGTTDVDYNGDPLRVTIDDEEQQYLCTVTNRYFKKTISSKDIIWTYSGVRPLHQDQHGAASTVSRDYFLELNTEKNQTPIMSIFGGKITTYRLLAEQVLQKIKPYFSHCGADWTAKQILPGGDFGSATLTEFIADKSRQYSWLPANIVQRYVRAYGNNIDLLLASRHSIADLGEHFGAGLYQAEVNYLQQHEWASGCDDILWRRTKLGLHLNAEEQAFFKEWLARH